jgi:selenocysteine lyase/cysteine desulfurase
MSKEVFVEPCQIRELIPATCRYAYLNHAATAALSVPVLEAMSDFLRERASHGSEALSQWEARLEGIRRLTADFIGAHRDEITFTSSVSHGLNIVAAGLDWLPGDNLICAETEFPANIYPWTNLQRRGIEVRFVQARGNRLVVDDFAALMDDHTRLLAVSLVEFGTGYRNDIDSLAELCHQRGVYLCVDGIQGIGALPFDVRQTPVHFLATQAAKWMLGPVGIGFLYTRRDLLSRIEPIMAGWRSVVDRDDYYCYDSPLRASGERFEPGSLCFSGLVGMEAAIKLLLSIGLEEIEAKILNLTASLIARLQSRRYIITSPIAHRRERSGIICFRHPSVGAATLAERLRAADVIVSQRGDIIRVSPHCYNTEGDLGRLLDALPPVGG